jgi:hypothetical protein
LIEELSVQVSWIAIFIFLRVGYMQCHVTPPHYAITLQATLQSSKAITSKDLLS